MPFPRLENRWGLHSLTLVFGVQPSPPHLAAPCTYLTHRPILCPAPLGLHLPARPPSGLRPRSPELSHIRVCPLPPPRIYHTHLLPQILRLSPPWEASSLGPGVLGALLAPGPPPSSLIRWNCTVIVSSSAQHPTPLGEAERQRRSALPSTRLRACSEFQISVDG